MNKEILLSNIDKIHTTKMGMDRIKKNLKLDTNDGNVKIKGKINSLAYIDSNINKNKESVFNKLFK